MPPDCGEMLREVAATIDMLPTYIPSRMKELEDQGIKTNWLDTWRNSSQLIVTYTQMVCTQYAEVLGEEVCSKLLDQVKILRNTLESATLENDIQDKLFEMTGEIKEVINKI